MPTIQAVDVPSGRQVASKEYILETWLQLEPQNLVFGGLSQRQ
jgi:hypothetical protein